MVNPVNGRALRRDGEKLIDEQGASYPILNGVPQFCGEGNYTDNFGLQWNMFARTQIDDPAKQLTLSAERFFATTAWPRGGLAGETVLEVGSGAGRFSHVVL